MKPLHTSKLQTFAITSPTPCQQALLVIFATSAATLAFQFLHNIINPTTGEEIFTRRGVPIASIETEGDSRVRRIFSILKKSSAGDAAFKYAAEHRINFQWMRKGQMPSALASYTPGLVRTRTDDTDHSIVHTISHEIRHGQQDHEIQSILLLNDDPDFVYTLNVLNEVDSCAYAANLTAQHKDQTGVLIAQSHRGYGAKTAMKYTLTPQTKRRFFEDAVLPCFDELKDTPYRQMAMKKAKSGAEAASHLSDFIKKNPALLPHYEAKLVPVSDQDKVALYKRFFTPDMKEGSALPEIENMKHEDRLAWFREMTRTPEIARELDTLSDKFAKGHEEFRTLKTVSLYGNPSLPRP